MIILECEGISAESFWYEPAWPPHLLKSDHNDLCCHYYDHYAATWDVYFVAQEVIITHFEVKWKEWLQSEESHYKLSWGTLPASCHERFHNLWHPESHIAEDQGGSIVKEELLIHYNHERYKIEHDVKPGQSSPQVNFIEHLLLGELGPPSKNEQPCFESETADEVPESG